MTRVTVDQALQVMAETRRQRLTLVTALCGVIAALTFAIYVYFGQSVAGGHTLLPLDDAYIHLRYADQIASGQFYRYNPIDPPTSGATSFLYPYLLAIGVHLPADPLNAAVWSILLGAAAFAASGVFVYQIATALDARFNLALLAALAFMFNGALAWHAMSGMETMLVVLAALATIDAVLEGHIRQAAVAGALSALLRPEGAILAGLASLTLLVEQIQALPLKRQTFLPPRWAWRREWRWLALPILAIFVQPLVNLLVTGTAVATGNSAKSLFGIIPFDFGIIAGRILDNFLRLWREFLIPSDDAASYLIIGFGILAVVGIAAMIHRRETRLPGVMIVLWMLVLAAAISTLDTAFWHFKRYQMPIMALLLPLAAVGVSHLLVELRRPQIERSIFTGAVGLTVIMAVSSSLIFFSRYLTNVGYIAQQPYQMAQFLQAYPDRNARVAVHDVGLIRYLGGLNTIDIVGLTTPGAADWWRNGVGSVGEFLEKMRPDLIASYGEGHGLGLGYLAHTDLYKTALAEYRVSLDRANNVALAAAAQGIYAPDWSAADRADIIALEAVTRYLQGFEPVDSVDVADLDSERAHDYQWTETRPPHGFPTEYNQFSLIGCIADLCDSMDGGRRINGAESFTLHAQLGRDLILLTRVHSGDPGAITVFVNGARLAQRVIPALPGSWLDIPVLIPKEQVTADTHIEIDAELDGDYQPYYHRAYQGQYIPAQLSVEPTATAEDGAIQLGNPFLSIERYEDGRAVLVVTLGWATDGRATGDLKRYIHVLDADGQIAAQADGYPANGALPPGNWLPGMFFEYVPIDITTLPPGHYEVAAGLYDPTTNERPVFTGTAVDELGRVRVSAFDFPPP